MLDRITLHILTFFSAIVFVGCSIIEDNDPCPETEDSEYLNLSFQVVAPAVGSSRTDDYDEADSEWSEFENRIYADDIAFYIYAELSSGNAPLLIKVDDFTNITDPHTSLSGGPKNYTLKVSIPKGDFENIVPTDEKDIKLKIVTFANTGKVYKSLSPGDYSTFNSLIAKASEWTYNIFDLIYKEESTFRDFCRIPMYGTATINVTRENFYKTRPDVPLRGPDIQLLRSVAKVKVIDNIANRDESTGLPCIETVTFNGQTNSAYMLPNNAIDYENGKQVQTLKLCNGTAMQLALYKIGDNEWIGYVPESKVEGQKFIIKVIYALKEDGTPLDQKTFEVPLSGYNDQTFGYGENILRNHTYILQVDGALHEIKFKLGVVAWIFEKQTEIEMKASI